MILSEANNPETMLLTCRSGGFEALKDSDFSKSQKEMQSLMIDNSSTPAENLLLMVELRKKILTFRDIIDLPPCDDRGPLNELVIGTVEDLHKLYPKVVPSIPMSELDGASTHQVLSKLYNALTSIGNSWVNNHKWLSKFEYQKEGEMKNISLAQLGDRVLAKLDYMIMVAREIFDVLDEDGNKSDESPINSTFGDILRESYSDIKASHCQSPVTPTSVIQEFAQSFADVSYSPPLLWPLRLQAVGKLKPIDVKRLSFHMFPHVVSCGSSPEKERKIIEEVEPEKKRARSSSEMSEVIDKNVVLQSNLNAPSTPKAPPLPPPLPEIREPKALSQPILPLQNLSAEPHTVWQTMLPKVCTGRPMESLTLPSNVSRAPYPSAAMVPPRVSTLLPEQSLRIPPNSCAVLARPSSPPKLVPNGFTAPPPPPTLQKHTFSAPLSTLPQNASVAPPPPPTPLPTLTKKSSAAPTVPENACIPPPPPMLPLNASMSPSVAPPMAPPNSSKAPPPPPPPQMLRPTSSTTPPPPPLPPRLQTNASTAPPPLLPPMLQPNESTEPPPPPPQQPMLQSNSSTTLPPPPPPPPMLQAKTSTAPPPPPPPMLQPNTSAAPPPPMLPSRGSVPLPPPPMSLPNGSAPPPPPPGAARSLRPKKANTKLKRSSQMGNLYRVLKGKLEGCNQDGKASTGRKNVSGTPCAGGSKQSMADALAEMTKRSSYFQQIEEDVQKHAKIVMEMKTAINSFLTSDMAELLKFHQHVESHLEKLTDETQVLARFEDFPTKKLETLRTAAALFSKVDAMLTNLTTWKIETPLAGTLDKVENYFNKIKGELEAMERTKDEESKRFQSHKITFDFHILVRIKESVVDLSSSCMEFALKERREAKAATDGDTGPKAEKRLKACTKMLWRAFQLAFRVYTFAGGHDDRADMLSKELAQEIENDPHH